MPAIVYNRVSRQVYSDNVLKGTWTIVQPPSYWNGVAAMAIVTDKQGQEIKAVIIDFFIN